MSSLKSLELEIEGQKYTCNIQIIDELMQSNLFLANKLKYRGNTFLEKIQCQIKAFFDYNINEIFEEINKLNDDNFSIIKENDKYKLKIDFIILNKKRNLIVDLNENIEIINKYENIIKEKDEIISELKSKIEALEAKLIETKENEKEEINYELYNNFDISTKKPIHSLNSHTSWVYCLTMLEDGRLVSGSADKDIIVYNKTTFEPDLTIKEHNSNVFSIIKLSSGILASCSDDKTIKFFNIKEKSYENLQTLNYHKDSIYQIIELKNKHLVSCSRDKSIIFYLKDNSNSEYQKDFVISASGSCISITQIKENEICYLERSSNMNNICFFDLNEKKVKASISNINNTGCFGAFNMIAKDLLVISGENKMSIVDVNKYKLVRVIEEPNAGHIRGFCMLNKKMFLVGDNNGIIRQWKIEGDNISLISKKEMVHTNGVCALLNMGEGHIASGSFDNTIKIW